MNWLTLLGARNSSYMEMNALQCIHALKKYENISSNPAQEIIERLEWVTGHPDIMTYLQDNPWRSRATQVVNNDIVAEVRLLNQLIDFTPPEDDSYLR